MRSLTFIESAQGAGQDRAAVIPVVDGLLIVVADGAGGVSGGTAAADAACAYARHNPQMAPAQMLRGLDAEWCERGEAAVAVAHITPTRIRGAWAGDVFAWQLTDAVTQLTTQATPRVGSGRADPHIFEHSRRGAVLMASDGLWKFVGRPDLLWAAQSGGLAVLVAAARLPNGRLRDDLCAVVIF